MQNESVAVNSKKERILWRFKNKSTQLKRIKFFRGWMIYLFVIFFYSNGSIRFIYFSIFNFLFK